MILSLCGDGKVSFGGAAGLTIDRKFAKWRVRSEAALKNRIVRWLSLGEARICGIGGGTVDELDSVRSS